MSTKEPATALSYRPETIEELSHDLAEYQDRLNRGGKGNNPVYFLPPGVIASEIKRIVQAGVKP